MDNKQIKDKIENDFGWLTPDEKQKLNSLLISVWNDAVVASSNMATRIKIAEDEYWEYHRSNSGANLLGQPIPPSQAINALKLKP